MRLARKLALVADVPRSEARQIVRARPPMLILEGLSREYAASLKEELKETGAAVEIHVRREIPMGVEARGLYPTWVCDGVRPDHSGRCGWNQELGGKDWTDEKVISAQQMVIIHLLEHLAGAL